MDTFHKDGVPDKELPLRAGLWLAQVLLAGVYLPSGIAVLALPASRLMSTTPWAAYLPMEVLKFIGVMDLAAGLGIILPSLTRIAPRATVLTAVCSAVLQLFAILFHAAMIPAATMPPESVALLGLSVFIAWGRSGKAAIAPRRKSRQPLAIDVLQLDHAGKPARHYRRSHTGKTVTAASSLSLSRRFSPRFRRPTATGRPHALRAPAANSERRMPK